VVTMEMFGKVRRMFFRDGISRSEIARRTGLSRTTIKKWVKVPLLKFRHSCSPTDAECIAVARRICSKNARNT
jgi:transposase